MSLDCFPLIRCQAIGLDEQPMALDVAYEENLLVTVVDGCQTVVVYEIGKNQLDEVREPLSSFTLGPGVVIDKVVYCKTGDYIVCVGHKNGYMALHAVFNWRPSSQADHSNKCSISIEELELNETTAPFDEVDRSDKLEGVDACQKTGNLAASYGDLVVIYQYNKQEDTLEGGPVGVHPIDEQSSDQDEDDLDKLNELLSHSRRRRFTHIMSVRVAIWVHQVSLVENYLSLATSDHVQVIKLELLTLQIQSDGQNNADVALSSASQINQTNRSSSGSSGGGGGNPANVKAHRSTVAGRGRRVLLVSNGGDAPSTTTGTTASSAGDTDSIMSNSNNSTATNFSAFNTTATTITENQSLASATPECSDSEQDQDNASKLTGRDQVNNDSDMSIITMNNNQAAASQQAYDESMANTTRTSTSQDECITWNLNTKKLVKLPTLMHNTSSDLSSYHICHPVELLGPASESIACRVLARLYSRDFCQNQLEPVILLCRQFDCDRDPVKSTHLQPIYLSSQDDQRRLNRPVTGVEAPVSSLSADSNSNNDQHLLLKSTDHELLASVTCFVATLSSCSVYSLHGKKVTKIQTITHPDLCLDLRPDLLNVYLLTPLGLQICSTGLCDSTFRYDWSSSADLNLSFVACNRARVLATSEYIVMVSSGDSDDNNSGCCIEVLRKPNLGNLFKCVVHIIKRCQSISIRSNLLTYLHASSQLALISSQRGAGSASENHANYLDMLKDIAIMLCKQLLQKKQTNVITNSRIDKVIKHLLDISHCDLEELMSRHIEHACLSGEKPRTRSDSYKIVDEPSYDGDVKEENEQEDEDEDDDDDDELPVDSDYELLTIYLRHTKYNPSILAYLLANSSDEIVCPRLITDMFENNPRLLIKCAQRFVKDNSQLQEQTLCLNQLVDRLKQLVEFDSTGINRATVLFTLANLYNADGKPDVCLQTLSQIKPQSHLAITMCSNHEITSRDMAKLVAENYPEVFKLFLNQLAKRDPGASHEFAKILEVSNLVRDQQTESGQHDQDLVIKNFGANIKLADDLDANRDTQQSPDEDEQFDQRLRLLAEIDPVELADLFAKHLEVGSNESEREDDATIEAYLQASIGLLESKFILSRLCESSR